MPRRHPSIPPLWLLSDARNDDALDATLKQLPRGTGFVFRHYHLDDGARRRRFAALRRIAATRGHVVALADTPQRARQWGADAVYGAPCRIGGAHDLLKIATVHSLRELGAAQRSAADLAMLSPVFATQSHPGAAALGPVRALLLARQTPLRVVALGGVDRARARRLSPLHGWAAIDGLSRRSSR